MSDNYVNPDIEFGKKGVESVQAQVRPLLILDWLTWKSFPQGFWIWSYLKNGDRHLDDFYPEQYRFVSFGYLLTLFLNIKNVIFSKFWKICPIFLFFKNSKLINIAAGSL